MIGDVADFPRPEILFRDITPVFGEISLPVRIASWMAAAFAADSGNHRIDAVACVEARGFMLGPLVARELEVGLIPVRKPDKLPRETLRQDYDRGVRHRLAGDSRRTHAALGSASC